MVKYPPAKYLWSSEAPSPHRSSVLFAKAADPTAASARLADIAALKNVLGIGAGMFGLGAFARSLKEVPTVIGGGNSLPVTMTGAPMPVEVPIPLDAPQPSPGKPPLRPAKKAAGFDASKAIGNAATYAYDNLVGPAVAAAEPLTTTNPLAKAWHAPAMVGAATVGGAAGWKLVDWLADSQRRGVADADLSAAKQEYEDAVKGLHVKSAGLDAAREQMRKSGDHMVDTMKQWLGYTPSPAAVPQIDSLLTVPTSGQSRSNYMGLGANTLLGVGALTAVPAALLAYKHTRNNSDTKALQEALMARRRSQQQRNPAPPHLVLQPAE
jgi:hypothetical protein